MSEKEKWREKCLKAFEWKSGNCVNLANVAHWKSLKCETNVTKCKEQKSRKGTEVNRKGWSEKVKLKFKRRRREGERVERGGRSLKAKCSKKQTKKGKRERERKQKVQSIVRLEKGKKEE